MLSVVCGGGANDSVSESEEDAGEKDPRTQEIQGRDSKVPPAHIFMCLESVSLCAVIGGTISPLGQRMMATSWMMTRLMN